MSRTKTERVTGLISRGPGDSPAPAVPEAGRTIEAVTGEILALKAQAGEALLEIGKRLIEAKGLLPHGDWLPWLETQVDFSERTAQNLMRIAREWENPQQLRILGVRKVLALLSLPPVERDEFMQENPPENMTAVELERAIRERDEAREKARAQEQEKKKIAEELDIAKKSAEVLNTTAARERERADAAEARVKELEARPVDVAVEPVPDEKAIEEAAKKAASEARAAAETAYEAKLKAADAEKQTLLKSAKMREEALEAERETNKKLAAELKAARDKAEAAEKAAKNAAKNADLPEDKILYKILCEEILNDANKLSGIGLKARQAGDKQLDGAVKKALEMLSGKLAAMAGGGAE